MAKRILTLSDAPRYVQNILFSDRIKLSQHNVHGFEQYTLAYFYNPEIEVFKQDEQIDKIVDWLNKQLPGTAAFGYRESCRVFRSGWWKLGVVHNFGMTDPWMKQWEEAGIKLNRMYKTAFVPTCLTYSADAGREYNPEDRIGYSRMYHSHDSWDFRWFGKEVNLDAHYAPELSKEEIESLNTVMKWVRETFPNGSYDIHNIGAQISDNEFNVFIESLPALDFWIRLNRMPGDYQARVNCYRKQ